MAFIALACPIQAPLMQRVAPLTYLSFLQRHSLSVRLQLPKSTLARHTPAQANQISMSVMTLALKKIYLPGTSTACTEVRATTLPTVRMVNVKRMLVLNSDKNGKRCGL